MNAVFLPGIFLTLCLVSMTTPIQATDVAAKKSWYESFSSGLSGLIKQLSGKKKESATPVMPTFRDKSGYIQLDDARLGQLEQAMRLLNNLAGDLSIVDLDIEERLAIANFVQNYLSIFFPGRVQYFRGKPR